MTQNKLILIGKKLGHSFSEKYFQHFFIEQGLSNWSYQNYEIASLNELDKIKKVKDLRGCNVTIPYKEAIIPLLDEVETEAQKIGAVNTILVQNGKFIGYNTDQPAFKTTLLPHLETIKGALVLGTGGASKAVISALGQLEIPYLNIGRTSKHNYENFEPKWLKQYNLIINCTPLGMKPNIRQKPILPYNQISSENLLYDLVYNPSETAFLKEGKKRNALCINGQAMLELQADLAFKIWSKKQS